MSVRRKESGKQGTKAKEGRSPQGRGSQPSPECLCKGAVKKPVLLHGVSSKEKAILVAFSHKLTRSSR
jgi:hypothetical protein